MGRIRHRNMSLLEEWYQRGLVAQIAGDEVRLAAHLAATSRTLYCGFDPTADSLHVGSLMPLIALRRLRVAGHTVIALIGDATAQVGDPSFKEEERTLADPERVAHSADRLEVQLRAVLDAPAADGAPLPGTLLIERNLSWYGERQLLDFLRDPGKHSSVNTMLRRESVRRRLEREDAGISFAEFSYALLQAEDFDELRRRHACTAQLGGSDQWGNITAGIELARRRDGAELFGLTMPLVTRADGGKFGKTEAGAVWLDSGLTSPYAFYQFWRNVPDADVHQYRRYFSAAPLAQLQRDEQLDADADGQLQAPRYLAEELTQLVHGAAGLAAVQRISEALFGTAIETLEEGDLAQLAQDGLPCTRLGAVELPLLEALVLGGLARTPRGAVTIGQARKFVREGAISVNGCQQRDVDTVLRAADGLYGRYHLLRRGKKHYHLLCWEAV